MYYVCFQVKHFVAEFQASSFKIFRNFLLEKKKSQGVFILNTLEKKGVFEIQNIGETM